MAQVIHALWAHGDQSPLILPGSVPLDDPAVLSELDHWLIGPPAAGTMVLVELIVLPIVLTACVAVLQTGFEFTFKDGKIAIKGGKERLAGKDLSTVLTPIYKLLERITALPQ
jgi:hypothetical protein